MAGKNVNNLVIENLSVNYNGSSVLSNLNLYVKEGEFVAVIGQSGCGKTTLLNAIAGFIKFKGTIQKPSKIGVVFQNYAVFPWLSLKNNISFGLGDNSNAINHYLGIIGLKKQKNKFPFELSGGQVQRVALARALASDPDIILMDEPYGALDAYTREKMQKWLLDIWKKDRKTIIFVTHSIEEAIFLADRILVLNDNQVKKEFKIGFRRPRNENIKFSKNFIKIKKIITELLG